MKLRELLSLIETSDADLLGSQVFVQVGSDLFETLSVEIDADGDLVIAPDLNVKA